MFALRVTPDALESKYTFANPFALILGNKFKAICTDMVGSGANVVNDNVNVAGTAVYGNSGANRVTTTGLVGTIMRLCNCGANLVSVAA